MALDVVGHEMSHGVTEHGSNLLYINQSGAINEAISDYFGNAMEADDLGMSSTHPQAGLIGEHLCRDETPEDCALRDLNDGRRADQDYRLLSVDYDNGGVHLNSTIVGGALWDIREAIAPHFADRIINAAQTEYLTPLSDFTDLRRAVELAAKRAHASAADRAVIAKAFNDRGVVRAGRRPRTRPTRPRWLATCSPATRAGPPPTTPRPSSTATGGPPR